MSDFENTHVSEPYASFALSVHFIDWGTCTNNVWLLVVHPAFTAANSVHLTTADYLISLSDKIATVNTCPQLTTQRTNSYVRGATKQSHSYSLVSARVYTEQTLPLHFQHMGTAVAQWLRCCATNRKVTGSIPAGVSEFFIDIKSFRSHYGPGVDSASNRNEYQKYFLGVKAAGA